MRALIVAMAALTMGVAALGTGCGGERDERGLALPSEQAVPMDPAEMKMTEEERREKALEDEAAAERKAFDEATDPGSGS